MKFLVPVALLTLSLVSCSKPKPPATEVPTYETFHRGNLNGTYFHFDHDGELYLGCSIHQGGNAPGTVLTRHGSSDTVTLGKQIHAQKDLRILKFQSDSVTGADALPYLPHPEVLGGDPVVILNRGEKIRGTVVRLPVAGDHHYFLKTSKPFAAAGMSGSPVFSKRLGTVVGILQTADNQTAATLGGFEILEMP